MKADGVLNLLKFQCFQSVRMTSSLARSTTQAIEISTVFDIFGVVGFDWKWLAFEFHQRMYCFCQHIRVEYY